MVQGMKPSAPMQTRGSFPLLCLIPPPLLHLCFLIASIYYLVILKLLNYVEVRAAEEQGEAKAVGGGETCLAGVHNARRPAFHTSVRDSCAGWAAHPMCRAMMGMGDTATR